MSDMQKIVSIEKFKGNTYCITMVSGDTIYLHSSFISQYSLKADMDIPQSALDSIVYENDLRKAKERALYLLEYRDHSYKELFDKLMKNYSEDICFDVMNKMVELRLINDREYAKRLARQLYEVKHAGKYKVRNDLAKKGISRDIIDEVTEEYEDKTSELLGELVERKYAKFLVDDKGIKKVTGALSRLGYSYRDIRDVLNKYLDEVEY